MWKARTSSSSIGSRTEAPLSSSPTWALGIGDPLKTGLVASLARPGGNITGSTILGPEVGGQRLALLKEALPRVSRVAFLWNPDNASNAVYLQDLRAGARTLGVTLQSVEVRSPSQFESAFAAMTRERPDALTMTADPMLLLHVRRVVDFATKNRLPAMYQVKENVEAGGLPQQESPSARGSLGAGVKGRRCQ
jgi:putative ABC transport system substrate-binding protein